jgi:glycosyltransferase involved in cell wall biosynthesis
LVVAPSAGLKRVLENLGVEARIDVVPNGVDLEPFRQKPAPIDRIHLGFHSEDVILIYTGRLGPEKNLPFLLRSFAGIVNAIDHVGLVIVGDGPERENLVDRVKHMNIDTKVHFTGAIPYDDIPRYLGMADAFVTASVSEVHPLSVIEALASGLPVLGIDSPGVGDTVIDGSNGFLVDREEIASYTAKMMRLVSDHELRRIMSEVALSDAQRYDIENTSRILFEKYQEVVDAARGQGKSNRSFISRILGKRK